MADEGTALTNEPTQTDTSSGTWRSDLPEELREAGSLKDIPDVGTLAKAYVDAQSYIGGSIRIPGQDAGEEAWSDFKGKLNGIPGLGTIPTPESPQEDWASFYNKLGRPENADGYSIDRPENLPGDPEAEQAFLEKMHEVGLNNKQRCKPHRITRCKSSRANGVRRSTKNLAMPVTHSKFTATKRWSIC